MPHTVVILAGTVLPKCARCEDKVCFIPMVPADPIEKDHDFAKAGVHPENETVEI
jgi:hypothetical protein